MAQMHLFRRSFSHGVHPREFKDITNAKKTVRLPFAPEMILPLSQSFGKPAVPLVHEGQEVVRGEPIARADGFMSVPLHAPATGIVKRIGLMPTARGPKTECIILKLYPGASQDILYDDPCDIDQMEPADIIQAVQDTGMVGLGGAAFPTHVKLAVPKEHTVDTVLINGCECEPYLTTDHRLMLEHAEDLIIGIRIVMRAVGAKQAIVGIEDNKLDAVRFLRDALPPDSPIRIKAVKTKYPQGAEKMLAKTLVGREVLTGGYPSEVGLGVYNVATLAQLGALLPHHRGLIERIITITGPGVKKPGNYLVALGTPLRFVLEQIGVHGSAHHLILGGPMMGNTAASLDVPVTKAVGGILVLTEEQDLTQRPTKVYPCIKCAKCVQACPIHLNPTMLGLLAVKRRYQEMADDYHLNDCFECGCCSYACPAGIPLVQYFRIAKSINRERVS